MDEKTLNSMITFQNIGRMTVKDALEKGLLEPLHNRDCELDDFTLSEHFYSLHEGLLGHPPIITIICPVCKKVFTAPVSERRKYCSLECSDSFRTGKSFKERFGVEKARAIRENMSKLMTGKKKPPGFGAKMSKLTTKLWEDPEYRKKQKEASDSRPNHFEVEFGTFFPELTYTGNFSFFVGRKNPDFILKGTNKCVDLFGDPWHEETEVQKRIEYFSQKGYRLLIVWESEWKEDKNGDIIQRVNEFLGTSRPK